MSKFRESYVATERDKVREAPALVGLQTEFPTLADALLGAAGTDGGPAVPPCTLMLFVEADKVKFCLNPKYGDRIAFGTLTDPEKGLSGVEWELSEGRFEWKKRGKKG